MIFQTLNPKQKILMSFIGNELFSVYYKIACEICDCRGDLENAMRYLNQCKFIGKKIGIHDFELI
jgi:PHP family Zn ribbon phosphoesterase